MSESLEDRIKRHEGFCSVPKPDSKGMFEIGYGHDLTLNQAQEYTDPISVDDANDLLCADIAYFKGQLADHLPWVMDIPSPVPDIIIEMLYQMGLKGVLGFHDMLIALRQTPPDLIKAASAMLASEWYKETPSRCSELAKLMRDGYTQSNTTT